MEHRKLYPSYARTSQNESDLNRFKPNDKSLIHEEGGTGSMALRFNRYFTTSSFLFSLSSHSLFH